MAVEETRNYTTRALASLATQIHNLSSNIYTLLDEQTMMIEEMEGKMNYLNGAITFKEQKQARRDIGRLSKPKSFNILPKVAKTPNKLSTAKNARYIREPIDYTLLDNVGQAHKIHERFAMMADGAAGNANTLRYMTQVKSATLRPSKSSNLFSVMLQQQQQQQTADAKNDMPHGSQTLKLHRTIPPSVHLPGKQLSGNQLEPFYMSKSQYMSTGGTLSRNPKDHRALVPTPIVAPPKLPQQKEKIISSITPNQQIPKQSNVSNLGKMSAATYTQPSIPQSTQQHQQQSAQQHQHVQQQNKTQPQQQTNQFLPQSQLTALEQALIPENYIEKGKLRNMINIVENLLFTFEFSYCHLRLRGG